MRLPRDCPWSFRSHHLTREPALCATAPSLSILEQPYKTPYYAAVVALLAASPHMPGGEDRWSAQDAAPKEEVKANVATGTIGRQLVEALVRSFRASVDARNWLETRLLVRRCCCLEGLGLTLGAGADEREHLSSVIPPPLLQVQLFAHLTAIGLVSPESLLTLLQSLLAVIDELGVNPSRVEQAVVCVGEALIRVRLAPPTCSDALRRGFADPRAFTSIVRPTRAARTCTSTIRRPSPRSSPRSRSTS